MRGARRGPYFARGYLRNSMYKSREKRIHRPNNRLIENLLLIRKANEVCSPPQALKEIRGPSRFLRRLVALPT